MALGWEYYFIKLIFYVVYTVNITVFDYFVLLLLCIVLIVNRLEAIKKLLESGIS